MADGTHNHKRGAPGDKQGHNPVNTRPPQEYIVLIGGPTNTFNAWWSYVTPRKGAVDRSSRDGFFAAQPAPRTMRKIDYYLGVAPRRMDKIDLPEYQRDGWSSTALKELADRGWTTSDVRSAFGPETHDRYCANFIDPAARLYSQSSPMAAPLVRPAPVKGDIVTFMIYAPPYERRQKVDWSASPYNHWLHGNKHGIKGNPLYDPSARRTSEPVNLREYYPDLDKPGTYTEHDKREQEMHRQAAEEARRNYKDQPLTDTDIDHYILMRTTSENSATVIKRPKHNTSYFDYLEDILLNAVRQKGVMTKLLFCSHPRQVIAYIAKGAWSGEPLIGMVDESEVEDLAREEAAREAEIEAKGERLQKAYDVDLSSRYGLRNHRFFPQPPVPNNPHSHPLYWNRLWSGAPGVDRNRIKIARFDYFGHSSRDTMMLDWGWANDKGEVPDVGQDSKKRYLRLAPKDFDGALSGNVVQNGFATLWGCHMGHDFAPRLANHFGEGVVAADTYTDFEKIIHNDTNMPAPVDGRQWVRYLPKQAAVPAGVP